jgi:hypothetical protein
MADIRLRAINGHSANRSRPAAFPKVADASIYCLMSASSEL